MIAIQKLLQDVVTFGDNLRRLREAKGLTQQDIATQLQLRGRTMTRTGYAHIEQGIRNIFISDLLLLRDILEISMDDIFEGLTPITKG